MLAVHQTGPSTYLMMHKPFCVSRLAKFSLTALPVPLSKFRCSIMIMRKGKRNNHHKKSNNNTSESSKMLSSSLCYHCPDNRLIRSVFTPVSLTVESCLDHWLDYSLTHSFDHSSCLYHHLYLCSQ